jgi:glucose-specific phosphotransferase system IIA component
MFGFFKKNKKNIENKEITILSPVDGNLMLTKDIKEDEAFAQDMLGKGMAVDAKGTNIVAPVSGKLVTVFDTGHAYGIETEEGLQVLVHIGINTVNLNGKGFTSLVKENDHIKAGDKIAEIDVEFIKSQGLPLVTPVIMTNHAEVVKSMEIIKQPGEVKAGEAIYKVTI